MDEIYTPKPRAEGSIPSAPATENAVDKRIYGVFVLSAQFGAVQLL